MRAHGVNGNVQLVANGLRVIAARDHIEYLDFPFAKDGQYAVDVNSVARGLAPKGLNEGSGIIGVDILGDGELEKWLEGVADGNHTSHNLFSLGKVKTVFDRLQRSFVLPQFEIYAAEKRSGAKTPHGGVVFVEEY